MRRKGERARSRAKGQKAELVVVDLGKGEHKQAAHLEHQPFGQVPALETDDGFKLYESRAMCRFIDETLPGPKLMPADAKKRAAVEQWVSVETSNFMPAAMKIIYQSVFAPMRGNTPDQAAITEGKTKLKSVVAVLEKQLAKTPYIAGDEFTFADVCYMPYIDYLYAGKEGSEIIEESPAVAAWWKKISARPSWKQVTGKA